MRRAGEATRPKEVTLKRPYETVVIYDATLSDDTVQSESGKLEEFLRKNAEFEQTVVMGKKHLAYPIRKKKAGVYHLYLYKGEGDVAGMVEKHLKLNASVLRHLSVVRSASVVQPAVATSAPAAAAVAGERA
jgi:small subunit ribosomal protein S6